MDQDEEQDPPPMKFSHANISHGHDSDEESEDELHIDENATGRNKDEDDEVTVTSGTAKSSQVIKYHGVKSRLARRYSNTSYHGTTACSTSSDTVPENRRSASAGKEGADQ